MQLLAPLQAMHTGCFGFQPSISKDRALRASAAVSAALAEWAALSNCSPTTWAQRVVKLLLSCIYVCHVYDYAVFIGLSPVQRKTGLLTVE